MNHLKTAMFTISVVALSAAQAFPIGMDHGPVGKTSLRADISPALRELINRSDRVHGYFVNSEDIFFYAGDTNALNQFLHGFAALKNTTLSISINQSLTHASSPWDKGTRATVANWRLYCAPYDLHASKAAVDKIRKADGDIEAIRAKYKEFNDGPEVARLQIRIGDGVELDKLNIPRHIELNLIDNEQDAPQTIKKFVVQHEELRVLKTNE